jgi:hypothetical protein
MNQCLFVKLKHRTLLLLCSLVLDTMSSTGLLKPISSTLNIINQASLSTLPFNG